MKYQRKNINSTPEDRLIEADSSESLLTGAIGLIVFSSLLFGLINYFITYKP